jgi:outer membrane receptor protein involved in Fe transport
MFKTWSKGRLFASSALLGATLAMTGAGFAHAADAAAAAASDATDKGAVVEEMVVTGSRLAVSGFDTLQPTQSLSADTLENRGFLNAGDALNELPIFGTAGSNNTGQQAGSTVGEQFVNLYNLGAQRTLVLVDGRRFVSGNAPTIGGAFAGAPPGQEVDLNDIPNALIDHLEIVTVGGAPIYGADAIAGTVNVILKKNYQGISLESQFGTSYKGDGKSYVGRALVGTNFADDRGNVTVAAEYTQQDGLTYADRPTTLPYQTQSPFASGCNYGSCLVSPATVASIFPGGIPTIGPGLANSGSPTYPSAIHNAAGQVVAFAPNGTLQPVNLGIQNNGEVFAQGGDGLNLAPESSFIAPIKRYLADSISHFDFTPHLTAYLETEFSHADGTLLAQQTSYQSAFFASQVGSAPIPFTLTNPYLTPQARGILSTALGSPTDCANAAATDCTFYLSRANLDLAPATFDNTLDTYRVVAGFKGDFSILGRKVNFDTSFNYGSSAGKETYYDINEANFLNAINVVTNPANGQIECAVTLNPPPVPPGYAGNQPSSVTGCVPLDLFGAGAPSQAARNFVTATDIATSLLTQRDVQANLTGSPFDLPAGPVKLAVGFEYRQETGAYTVDAFAAAGLGRNAPSSDVAGSYESKEYYVEATIPVISPGMSIPLINSLEGNVAYRHIDNSLSGPEDVYTFGGKYHPIADFEIRGNFTHSVRAPSIAELFLPTTNTGSFADDPCDPRAIGPTSGTRYKNCATAFAALGANLSTFASNVDNATVLGTTGGNPKLKDESANAWTAGVVARPHWFPHLSLSVDWINIAISDDIQPLTLTQVMRACYDSTTFPNMFCSLFTRNNQGQVTNFSTPYENISNQNLAGAQLEAQYSIDVNELPLIEKIGLHRDGDYGNLAFTFSSFFENEHSSEILGVVTPTRGNIGDPQWKFNGSVNYHRGPLNIYLNGRYVGPGVDDVTKSASSEQIHHVGAYWVWNTAISYDVTKHFTAELSVNNLFGQDPPQYAELLNANAALSTYDYFGQAFVFSLKAKF